MLYEICKNLNNFFVASKHKGNYKIEGGVITPAGFLQEGQYFNVIGSVFNDGVYKYPADGLKDETFTGEVWAMAVPPAVIALAEEINKYNASDAASPTPYQSESFPNGYSYTKASGSDGVADNSWQSVFNKRLSKWRKL